MGPGVQALAGGSRPGDRLSSPGGGVGGCRSESSKDWRQGSQVPLTKCVSADQERQRQKHSIQTREGRRSGRQ